MDPDSRIHLSVIVDPDPDPQIHVWKKWIGIRVPIFNIFHIFYKEIHVGQITKLIFSVSDPSHFDVDPDPDPRIHIWKKWIRIRVLIFHIFH